MMCLTESFPTTPQLKDASCPRCCSSLSSVLILRVESFTRALIAWGQEHLGASRLTIFDQAFPFLRQRQIQASRLRADAHRVPTKARDPNYAERPASPAACGPSFDTMGEADTPAETSQWEEGEGQEAEQNEGSRNRRKVGGLLCLDDSVLVRKVR